MSLADDLIQLAWSNSVGTAVKLWNGRIPETDQATYPNAGYVFTGYSDDDSPLSGSKLETERFSVSIAHENRRLLWEMARRFKKTVDELDHDNLANSSARIEDFSIPRNEAGRPLWYELSVEVTISLWNQED
ncbi:hypothetical protein GC170_14455 [bacterium]|nr:hypothetical protein [bacterium]